MFVGWDYLPTKNGIIFNLTKGDEDKGQQWDMSMKYGLGIWT
mgnify:CR=1 FL=1